MQHLSRMSEGRREDCQICRELQDMKKHGGEEIQMRNLRKLNSVNREALTKVPPKFMVVKRKNLLVTKIVKIPSNSFSVDPISIRIEEDLSENEEKIDRVQDLTQEVNIVGEVRLVFWF